jgi:LuxR family transcriptional regulator, maltose regulon positive regulatory protein
MNEQTKPRALPRRPRIIRRPRLTRLLDEAAERCRILMLIAPAGYGKTTLAREWIEQSGAPYAWYTAGSSSSDVAAVAADLASAVAAIVADPGRRLMGRLQATASPEDEVELLARLLAADLADWPEDSWLVIDDYHEIGEAPNRLLVDVLQGSELNVLIASRRLPPWATSKKLLYGELAVVDHRALAMDESEVRTLLGRQRSDDAPALVSLSQGWPAVVALAALTKEALPAEIPEHLYDYVAHEVTSSLSTVTRAALPDIALVGGINSVTDELLGVDVARAAGAELSSAGLVQSDRAGELTLHPLMRAFFETAVLELGSQGLGAKVDQVLHAYVARRRWDDAFQVIAQFRMIDRLPDLLVSALPELLPAGRVSTIERWLAFASEHSFKDAVIDIAAAEVASRKGEHLRGRMLAERAIEQLPGDSPLLCHAYAVAAHEAHFSGVSTEEALVIAERALAHANDEATKRESLWRVFVLQCDAERVEAWETLALLEGMQPRSEDDLLLNLNGRLLYAVRFGQIDRTLDASHVGARLLKTARNPLVRTAFCNNYAFALAAASRYDEALSVTAHEVADALEYGLDFVVPHAHAIQWTADIGLRNFARVRQEATASLGEDSDDPHIGAQAHGALARVLICEGRHQEALKALDTAPNPVIPGTTSELLSYRALAEAARGANVVALDLVEQAEELSRAHEVRVLTSFIRAICMLEKPREMRSILEAAMTATEQSRYVDRFVIAYRAAPSLLGAVAANAAWTDLADRAIVSGRDWHLAGRLGIKLPAGSDVERLTRREHEVLELIADGRTNQEIAQDLCISVPTAKVHVRHILEKLGVRTRTQAAVLAAGAAELRGHADDRQGRFHFPPGNPDS